jgi:penicillin-binding protein 1A
MENMEFQQYYPTYSYQKRDVVLSEFEEAQKISNTQSKLYGQLASLLLAFTTVGITILFKLSEKSTVRLLNLAQDNIILLNIFLCIIALVLLRYFIELQKTIVLNSRKVITLRKMLGLDYGNLQLTIPNWRVEGATNPFVIKLFPGWFRFGSSPFWIIVLTLNIFWYFMFNTVDSKFTQNYWYIISALITIFYALIFRIQLLETHETFYLIILKNISKLFRIKLISNFEYILYRTKLSVHELNRLKYKTVNLEKILLIIEDKRFFKHPGVDLKSMLRSILSLSSFYRKKYGILKSGGSTITMQLSRTLFIPSNQNVLFRKIVEILLSFWIEGQFSKKEILLFYLTSVRFERGINGIIAASKHFFPDKNSKEFSNEEAFILIERLSNITSTYKETRIKSIYDKVSLEIDLSYNKLYEEYKQIEQNNKINEI